MLYFQEFPLIQYTFDPNRQEFRTMVNIFTRIKMLNSVLTNSLVFYKYSMKDSDTLWGIADKYYGDPNRHWLIIFANVIIDPYFDLPLNQADFNNNIIIKYGSLANAESTLHHIQQVQNVTTTQYGSSNTVTYTSTIEDTGYTYDFTTKSLVQQTLPTLNFPNIDLGSTTVNFANGISVVTDTQLQAVSCYDYENNVNESKREIVLIDKSYAAQIESQFQQLLNQ